MSRSLTEAFWPTNRCGFYFSNFEDGFAVKPIPPLTLIKARMAKQFRSQPFVNAPPPLSRVALNRCSVTSGASTADSRNRANKDGANNRSIGMAGIHASGASMDDGSTHNSGKDGSSRNNGMDDANNRSGASKACARTDSASTRWRPL